MTAHCDTDVVSSEDREPARENERLRREICIRDSEKGILKMVRPFSTIGPKAMVEPGLREPKAMRFRFVEEQLGAFLIDRLC